MRSHLIVEGSAVYEIDEDCLKEKEEEERRKLEEETNERQKYDRDKRRGGRY